MVQRKTSGFSKVAAPVLAIAFSVVAMASGVAAQGAPATPTREASAGPAATSTTPEASRPLNWNATVAPIRRVRPQTPAATKSADTKRDAKKKTAQSAAPKAPATKKTPAAKGPGSGLKCADGFTYDAKQLRCMKPGAVAPAPRKAAKKAAEPQGKK